MKRVKWLDEGVKVRIEGEDDLWTLSQIFRLGSQVGMLSSRRDSTTGTREDGRAKSAERKPMWILLDVIESAFQPFTDNLRAHGTIREAKMDIGSHHTHVIGIGDEVEVSREGGLSSPDLSLLKESFKAGQKAKCGLIVVEADEVLVFEVISHGMRSVSQFALRGGGKRTSEASKIRKDFFERTAKEVMLVFADDFPLILCGPGMSRERFESRLIDLGSKNKIVNVPTSIGGRAAANEVLAEGGADALLGDHALVKQVRAIEEGMRRISMDGSVTYGIGMISDAAEQGAIETLVIEVTKLRSGGPESTRWEEIANKVNTSGGLVIQSSTDHDAGMQLSSLGGAIALLRWKIEE